jgi:hypothetical protein
MFEMITARLPFEGTSMEQMVMKTTSDPPALSTCAPGIAVAPALERLVSRLMARRPGARFASAHHVIEALDRLDRSGGAMDVTDVDRPAVPRRSRLAASIGVALLAAGAVAWGVSIWQGEPDVARASSPVASVGGAVVHQASASPSLPPAAVAADAASAVAADAASTEAASAETANADAANADAANTDTAEAAGGGSDAPPRAATTDDRVATGDSRPADRRRQRSRRQRPDRRESSVATSEPAAGSGSGRPTGPAEDRATGPRPGGTVAAPTVAVATAPQRPAKLAATIADVDVTGALAPAVIRRAVGRKLSALGLCTTTAGTITVRFVVGEAQRAARESATGGPTAANRCVEAVIRGVRTEVAPDVGDATVVIRIGFAARPPR